MHYIISHMPYTTTMMYSRILTVVYKMMRMSRGTFPCMGLRAMGLRKRGALASLICPRNQTLGLCIAILACLTGFSMTCRASTRFEGMAIEPGISIKGISVPIGSLQSKSPALTMKVGEIALEPSRIGIFRTPLVPSVVFKDVTLILHPATGESSWGDALSAFAKDNREMGNAVIRRFEVRTEDQQSCLKAVEGRFQASKEAIVLKGVEFATHDIEARFPEAFLLLKGPQSGCLVWSSADGNHSLPLPTKKI